MAMDRRRFMKVTLFGGLAAMGLAAGSGLLRYLYREVEARRVTIPASEVPDEGTEPRAFEERGYKFYLVQLDGEELSGSPRLLAFSRRCTHDGCTVVWESDVHSSNGTFENVFWCPCCGSVFKIAGYVESGPAIRALDQFETESAGSKVVVTLPDFDDSLVQYR